MIKRTLLLLALLLLIKTGYSQQAAYTFPTPQNWGEEKISFPISFAPKITLTGVEELRFTPGWGDSKTDEYWSYAFLWFVDGKPQFSADKLQNYLIQYFNGLYVSNLKDKKVAIPSDFTQVQIKNVPALPGDNETYEGSITTLNFLTGQPINFSARVHIRNYDKIKHTAVLYEISPKATSESVWASLNAIVDGFKVSE